MNTSQQEMCCLIKLWLLENESGSLNVVLSAPNKSLDASGGSASRNLLGVAKGALIRAAASTQPFGIN